MSSLGQVVAIAQRARQLKQHCQIMDGVRLLKHKTYSNTSNTDSMKGVLSQSASTQPRTRETNLVLSRCIETTATGDHLQSVTSITCRAYTVAMSDNVHRLTVQQQALRAHPSAVS